MTAYNRTLYSKTYQKLMEIIKGESQDAFRRAQVEMLSCRRVREIAEVTGRASLLGRLIPGEEIQINL